MPVIICTYRNPGTWYHYEISHTYKTTILWTSILTGTRYLVPYLHSSTWSKFLIINTVLFIHVYRNAIPSYCKQLHSTHESNRWEYIDFSSLFPKISYHKSKSFCVCCSHIFMRVKTIQTIQLISLWPTNASKRTKALESFWRVGLTMSDVTTRLAPQSTPSFPFYPW